MGGSSSWTAWVAVDSECFSAPLLRGFNLQIAQKQWPVSLTTEMYQDCLSHTHTEVSSPLDIKHKFSGTLPVGPWAKQTWSLLDFGFHLTFIWHWAFINIHKPSFDTLGDQIRKRRRWTESQREGSVSVLPLCCLQHDEIWMASSTASIFWTTIKHRSYNLLISFLPEK